MAQSLIPKDANTVIISGDFKQADKFNEVISILYESGTGTTEINKELGTITTAPKAFKNGIYTLTVLIKENKVTLRGQWNWTDIQDSGWQIIEYSGQKNSPKQNAWKELSMLADNITGTKEYLIK